LGLREDYRGRKEAGNEAQREAYAIRFAKAGEIAMCLSTILYETLYEVKLNFVFFLFNVLISKSSYFEIKIKI
jgi:hypothetical protein